MGVALSRTRIVITAFRPIGVPSPSVLDSSGPSAIPRPVSSEPNSLPAHTVFRRIVRWPAALALVVALGLVTAWLSYPSDKSPQGSYLRVVTAVNSGDAAAVFPYIETEAQHAAFTIGKYHRQAHAAVADAYPEPDRSRELERLAALARVEPGPGVFAWYATRYGWMDRLRLDLSGVETVEVNGDRATVETVRGTRYAFRKRDTGMWGLTLFTAQLVADGQKAARDFAQIEAAAKDYRAVQQLGN